MLKREGNHIRTVYVDLLLGDMVTAVIVLYILPTFASFAQIDLR